MDLKVLVVAGTADPRMKSVALAVLERIVGQVVLAVRTAAVESTGHWYQSSSGSLHSYLQHCSVPVSLRNLGSGWSAGILAEERWTVLSDTLFDCLSHSYGRLRNSGQRYLDPGRSSGATYSDPWWISETSLGKWDDLSSLSEDLERP